MRRALLVGQRALAAVALATALAAPAYADPDDDSDNTTNEICGAFDMGVPPADIPGRLGANDGRENYWTAQRQSAWPIIEGDCG
jgi:hypothetical protein